MAIQEEITRYHLETQIHRSDTNIVYLAGQKNLKGRKVIVKVFKPRADCSDDGKDELLEKFKYEGHIITQLKGKNALIIYELDQGRNYHYMVLEYLSGGPLKQKIPNLKPLDALDLLEKICACLKDVHHSGYIHCDIKPSNIMFREDGQPVLIDFGIAQEKLLNIDEDNTTSLLNEEVASIDSIYSQYCRTLVGTPAYMSPEQLNCEILDERTDIYSLGIVFYEMLTGKKLYRARNNVSEMLHDRRHLEPVLPRELSQYQSLLNKMTAYEPQDRFASTDEIVDFIAQTRPYNIFWKIRNFSQKKWQNYQLYLSNHPEKAVIASVLSIVALLFFSYQIASLLILPSIEDTEDTENTQNNKILANTPPVNTIPNLITLKPLQPNQVMTPIPQRAIESIEQTENKPPQDKQSNAKQDKAEDAIPETPYYLLTYSETADDLQQALNKVSYKLDLSPEIRKVPFLPYTLAYPYIVPAQPRDQIFIEIPTIDAERLKLVQQQQRRQQEENQATIPSSTRKKQRTRLTDPVAIKKQINIDLKQAYRHLQKGNLTSPKENNAYYYFSEVLKLDKNNQQAIRGIKRIVQKQIILTSQKIKQVRYKQSGSSAFQRLSEQANDYIDETEKIIKESLRYQRNDPQLLRHKKKVDDLKVLLSQIESR